MSYDHRARHYKPSTRAPLESIKASLLSQVEMAPDYSISQWRMARTMAWTGNTNIPTDLAEAHRQVTDSIVLQINAIAEKILINAEARIDQSTKDNLSAEILKCGVLTEQIRPMISAEESWPPSPIAGTGGEMQSAERMIAQIRAEVLRCNALSNRQAGNARH